MNQNPTGKRLALIIASYEYQDDSLRQLVAPAQDAEALARVLENPDIGGFQVQTLLNKPAHKVSLTIETFFTDRKRDDLLLLYFSGHGIKDDWGRLYFATTDTRRKTPRTTAIPATLVNGVMNDNRSRQVLLLDCCYSGAFARTKADQTVGIEEQVGGRGRVVLTSSNAVQYSFEGDEVKGEGVRSVFTSALVRGLETGEADRDRDGYVSLDELYEYVYDHVVDETPKQRPQMFATVEGKIFIAQNPRPIVKPDPKPAELPSELQQAIESPFAGLRAGAVSELERLLHGSDEGLALAARQALTLLADDDSRRVSATAAHALGTSPLAIADGPSLTLPPYVTKLAAWVPPSENLLSQLLERVHSMVTDNITGGGSMIATALAQAIVSEGLECVAAGSNPTLLSRGIRSGAEAVVGSIADQAIELTTVEEVANVAATSAQDQEIGELIANVMDKVGTDGVITVEESKGLYFETEYIEGMQFDQGYISPYFITDLETMEAVLEEPYILIYDGRISLATDIVPILKKLVQVGKPKLIIISDGIDSKLPEFLAQNKLYADMNILAVRAPGYGDHRKAMLQDIAILTGSQVITEEMGRKLETVQISDLGRADKVVSTKDNTAIVGGWGDDSTIRSRLNQIRVEIDNSSSDYDREKLRERLAKLAGGVVIIRVGAATKTELEEKKRRVEDALSAVCAAVEEGFVPGGGVALLNASATLNEVRMDLSDEQMGVNILRRALEEPMRSIVRSAGVDGAVAVEMVRQKQKENHNRNIGYDIIANVYTDMIVAGIVDPAKVIRRAVEIAISVVTTIFNELSVTRRAKPLS